MKTTLIAALSALLVLQVLAPTAGAQGAEGKRKFVEPLYVLNRTDGSIVVLEVKYRKGKVRKIRQVGTVEDLGDVWASAVDPEDGAFVAVTRTDGTLAVIDTETLEVSEAGKLGKDLRGIAVMPDGSTALMIDHRKRRLLVVDMATRSVVATHRLKAKPMDLVMDPSGTWAVITHLKKRFFTLVEVAGTLGEDGSSEAVSTETGGPFDDIIIRDPELTEMPGYTPDVVVVSRPGDGGPPDVEVFYPTRNSGDVKSYNHRTGEDRIFYNDFGPGGESVATEVFAQPPREFPDGSCGIPGLTATMMTRDPASPQFETWFTDTIGHTQVGDGRAAGDNFLWGDYFYVGDAACEQLSSGPCDGLGFADRFRRGPMAPTGGLYYLSPGYASSRRSHIREFLKDRCAFSLDD